MTLQEWIEDRKMRPEALAVELDISPRTVYELIKRNASPRLETAVKIAEISEGKISYREMLALRHRCQATSR